MNCVYRELFPQTHTHWASIGGILTRRGARQRWNDGNNKSFGEDFNGRSPTGSRAGAQKLSVRDELLGLLCRLDYTDVVQAGKVFKVLLFAAISFFLLISAKSAKVPLFLPGFCLSLIKFFYRIIPAVLTPMPNIFSFCFAIDRHHIPP